MKNKLLILLIVFVGCNEIGGDNGFEKMKPVLMNINSLHYKDYKQGTLESLETYYGTLVTIAVYDDKEICLTTSNDSMAGLIKKQLFDSNIQFEHNADEQFKYYEGGGWTVHQITYHKYVLPPCLTQNKLQ